MTEPMIDVESKDDLSSMERYKAYKQKLHEEMLSKQQVPYSIKVHMAKDRIRDFYKEALRRGLNCHVSVGGLDSIVLGHLIRSMGYTEEQVPFVSASSLEDISIQKVHKEMGCIVVQPLKPKVRILQEEGFPVLSKRIANKINTIANPTEKNKTVRHAIITGECGEMGHHATDSKMRLPITYLKLFGGLDEEGRALGYGAPTNFKVSHKCCYYLKEAPCDNWAKEHNSVPFLGLMASEGGQRADALEEHGCNYFGKTTARSCPFAFYYHSDVVHLAADLGVHIPEIYGEIKVGDEVNEFGDHEYQTTGEQRYRRYRMTIEEAIKHCEEVAKQNRELFEKIGTIPYDEDDYNCLECAKAHEQLAEWLKELKQLREQTRWIPVSERLPEEFESVLVCYKSQGGMAQAVSERFGTHTGYKWSALAGIEPIAWMPLPEPYKAESEGEQ